ncbi:hypothetical protein SAMN05421670_2685 [Psychrobacillus psychrotolerans]|uniref:Uncharacterized protein n=1 Tax=Psychrobacillus psychrotolerans TaxID=126156 RepID=A0A1I5ZH13_9BACI|nr:hypothetical protein [Psychrobacillus psychrotolerans]SFQ55738.1 hypothetical protein SAMN05421670_2685 [Psychrobacillus psychrotolerans]
MLSRTEKYKKIRRIKKMLIISGILVLSIGLGTGMKTALADVDVQQVMANWFSKKQDKSIKEIDQAIGAEREVLMGQLKGQLNTEMQLAEKQLAEFTATQKQTRITALQEYANNIKAGMKIDSSEQQAAVMQNIDIILANAKAQLDGQAAQLKLVTVPMPATAPVPASAPDLVVVPETTPAPAVETSPTTKPETEVIPETEKAPEKEVKAASSPVQKEPVVSPPVEVDIYAVTDWFVKPNTSNVQIEELAVTDDVFSINTSFSDILMNSQARGILNSILPGLEKHQHFHLIQYKTIEEMSRVAPGHFTESVLYLLNQKLSAVKK